MLCHLARALPPRIAQFLERDRSLKRNFREESVTDILMASLIGLEAFGIYVDLPDESITGGDMEWIYVAPDEPHGGRYLRLILQAKRAQISNTVTPYWFYDHLDHNLGQQAHVLVTHAAASGTSTVPLYIFYHPASALALASGGLPEIAGVNLVFADIVAPTVAGGCLRADKRVDRWRSNFMPLSDFLCWHASPRLRILPGDDEFSLVVADFFENAIPAVRAFHPDLVAQRIARRYEETGLADRRRIQPASGIPPEILRAISGRSTAEDRREIRPPRIIFSTAWKRPPLDSEP